jgi:hypothetical protein
MQIKTDSRGLGINVLCETPKAYKGEENGMDAESKVSCRAKFDRRSGLLREILSRLSSFLALRMDVQDHQDLMKKVQDPKAKRA